jgi:hypothetical protein
MERMVVLDCWLDRLRVLFVEETFKPFVSHSVN